MTKNIDLAEATRMLDSITELVADRRIAIARAVSSPLTSESLAEKVNQLAEAEGSFAAIEHVQRILAYADRTGEIVDWSERLMRTLLNGADDRWSGRGNDVKRAWFDGYRQQASHLLDV